PNTALDRVRRRCPGPCAGEVAPARADPDSGTRLRDRGRLPGPEPAQPPAARLRPDRATLRARGTARPAGRGPLDPAALALRWTDDQATAITRSRSSRPRPPTWASDQPPSFSEELERRLLATAQVAGVLLLFRSPAHASASLAGHDRRQGRLADVP